MDLLIKRAKRDSNSVGRDPNAKPNLVLSQLLAPAMFVHYLRRTGWKFDDWETITGGPVDVDMQLSAPDGTPVMFQVKSPDQPGRVVNHRIVDGEIDARVLAAVNKASAQLPNGGPEAKFIAVSANRRWPLSTDPRCLVTHLIGSTLTLESGVTTLPQRYYGKFWQPDLRHVSGVVMVDYLRGTESFSYPCTVLLNPTADVPASEAWFPHGRVAVLEGNLFRWVRGGPGRYHTLPDGTRLTG